jgi:hypothetical protein
MENTFTNEQRIRLIDEMINKAKFNFAQGSFYFILWGVLLIISSIVELYLQTTSYAQWSTLPWGIVGVIGGVTSGIYGAKKAAQEPSTHLEKVYAAVWMTYFATLALMIVSLVYNSLNPTAFILILTGLPAFFSGIVLNFNPLKIGGIVFWMLGVLGVFVFPQYSSLLFILSMMIGYIYPGIKMKSIRQ